MSTQVQTRRGTTAEHSTFTGAVGEVTVDTDKEVVVVHDGTTAGGYPQMRENGSNSALALGSAGTPSLKFAGDTNTGIYSPGADQLALSTNGTQRISIGSDGDINIDSGGVFYDASTNRLAIGTTVPGELLTVNGTNQSVLVRTTDLNGSARIKFNADDGNYAGIGLENAALVMRCSNSSTPAERARIDSSGRLLVGTSSGFPAANITPQFQVGGTSDIAATSLVFNNANTANAPQLLFGKARGGGGGSWVPVLNNDGIGRIAFSAADNAGDINTTSARIECFAEKNFATNDSPGRLVFSTTADGASSPTERMRITEDGRVLVGTTDTEPIGNNTQGIALRGDAGAIQVSRNGLTASFNRFTTNGEVVRFSRNGVDVGSIDVTTTATSYNTSSDYRLKENVVDLDGAINRLKHLPVHRFNFIADPDTTVDGFIAHEAAEVVPEAVTGTKDEVDEDGNPVHQGIDQSKLVPLLTAALQEAIERIETLEAEVAALKGS